MLFVTLFSEIFALLLVTSCFTSRLLLYLLLTELLECSKPVVLPKLHYLKYQWHFTSSDILVFFANLGYMTL